MGDTASVCIPLSKKSDSALTHKEGEKESYYIMVWSAMKFYWHESGKTAWSVFGTMLFCLIWYMCGLFIQIELNSLFQQGKKGLLVTERLFIVHYNTWYSEENGDQLNLNDSTYPPNTVQWNRKANTTAYNPNLLYYWKRENTTNFKYKYKNKHQIPTKILLELLQETSAKNGGSSKWLQREKESWEPNGGKNYL